MLNKKNRLQRQDFNNVYKKGKRIYNKYFLLFHLQLPKQSDPKIGIVASTKVGKANVRNELKRRIREIVKAELPQISKESQIIILTRQQTATLPFSSLQQEITTTLQQLKS